MTLQALEIPDDPAELPGWLEHQLISLDLAALVAELSAIHGASSTGPSLDEILGEHRDSVLAAGLRYVPPRLLGYLLIRPELLLDLQELILIAGGQYWDAIAAESPEHRERLTRGSQRMEAFLAQLPIGSQPSLRVLPDSLESNKRESDTTREQQRNRGQRDGAAWYFAPWVVSLATAAAVLFGVALYERSNPPDANHGVASTPRGWGWNKPEALQDSLTRSGYLESLAIIAGEWFDQRPDTPAELARRIGEFRQGCSQLLLADHKPLTGEDRDWLKDRCRQWASKLDAHLASVESGADVRSVREEVDETIRKLIDALRDRSSEVSV